MLCARRSLETGLPGAFFICWHASVRLFAMVVEAKFHDFPEARLLQPCMIFKHTCDRTLCYLKLAWRCKACDNCFLCVSPSDVQVSLTLSHSMIDRSHTPCACHALFKAAGYVVCSMNAHEFADEVAESRAFTCNYYVQATSISVTSISSLSAA